MQNYTFLGRELDGQYGENSINNIPVHWWWLWSKTHKLKGKSISQRIHVESQKLGEMYPRLFRLQSLDDKHTVYSTALASCGTPQSILGTDLRCKLWTAASPSLSVVLPSSLSSSESGRHKRRKLRFRHLTSLQFSSIHRKYKCNQNTEWIVIRQCCISCVVALLHKFWGNFWHRQWYDHSIDTTNCDRNILLRFRIVVAVGVRLLLH